MENEIERFGGEVGQKQIQWYPGHMAKAMESLRKRMHGVDVVLEVRDLRIARTAGRLGLVSELQPRQRVLVLSKADLAPASVRAALLRPSAATDWDPVKPCAFSVLGGDLQGAHARASRAFSSTLAQTLRGCVRQGQTTALVAAVVGLPNAGKSSLVNRALRASAARVGAMPGVTRHVGGFRVDLGPHAPPAVLLDAPGVLVPRIDSLDGALRLALAGALPDARAPVELLADYAAHRLAWAAVARNRPNPFVEALRLPRTPVHVDELLADVRERLGLPDAEAAAAAFVRWTRSGRFGPLDLDDPLYDRFLEESSLRTPEF